MHLQIILRIFSLYSEQLWDQNLLELVQTNANLICANNSHEKLDGNPIIVIDTIQIKQTVRRSVKPAPC